MWDVNWTALKTLFTDGRRINSAYQTEIEEPAGVEWFYLQYLPLNIKKLLWMIRLTFVVILIYLQNLLSSQYNHKSYSKFYVCQLIYIVI